MLPSKPEREALPESGQATPTAPLHLVSAFAADAGVILGQQATAAKSN